MKQAAAELKEDGVPGTTSSAAGASEEGKDVELVSGSGVDTVAVPMVAPAVVHSRALRCFPPRHPCQHKSVCHDVLEVWAGVVGHMRATRVAPNTLIRNIRPDDWGFCDCCPRICGGAILSQNSDMRQQRMQNCPEPGFRDQSGI